ncbi:MAG: putative lipid II flippase FtsW [Treponemataceae bacterium]|nr:putative lipid II flippase FtsW [Treponemataceae bacterium]
MDLSMEWTRKKQGADPIVVSTIILFLGVGLVTLYAASYGTGELFYNNGYYFIHRQLLFAGAGLVFFFFLSWLDLEIMRQWVKPLVILSFLMCVLPFIPGIGVVKNGAARWIRVGPVGFQPSELVKLVLPLYLAHILDKKQDRLDDVFSVLLPPLIIISLFFVIIYLQNNFSTASFIVLNGFLLLFLGGIRLRHFVGLAVIIAPIAVFMVITKEYRLQRLISFLQPEWDPLGAGFQIRASLATIRSGGILGKGLGASMRDPVNVPEIHSDFIFASFARDMGLVGVAFFFLVVLVFLVQSFRIAFCGTTPFIRLLTLGIATTLVTQIILNVAVVSATIPATGVPLPFFSAGGSSLFVTLGACGILVNVSRHRMMRKDVYV